MSPSPSNFLPIKTVSSGNSSAAKRVGAVARPDFKSARGALPIEAVEPIRDRTQWHEIIEFNQKARN